MIAELVERQVAARLDRLNGELERLVRVELARQLAALVEQGLKRELDTTAAELERAPVPEPVLERPARVPCSSRWRAGAAAPTATTR